MPGEQQQLDRDTLLMLYAADELPLSLRADFERRLASDPELAAALREVQAAQQRVDAGVSQLDRAERPPVSDAVATRRVMRAMQQWQVERAARAKSTPIVKTLPLPWWMYPTAAAAALLIGFLVWSSRQEVGPMPAAEEVRRSIDDANAENEAIADQMETWFEPKVELAESLMGQPQDEGAFFMTPEETQ